MSSVYIEYQFEVTPLQPGVEILIAELGYAGFESFVETEVGVTAYIQKEEWYAAILEEIQLLKSKEFSVRYTTTEIAQVNWNAEWEKNFDAIEVDDRCVVRAPFHPKTSVPYEIVIEPKMSFGTGHHETTFMMLQYILDHDFKDDSVLDMGCGTAVLAILAEKRGATQLDAIDIDPWCVENSEENIIRNNCQHITVQLGDAAVIPKKKYSVVIANINRNILLNDMARYKDSFLEGGTLYLSGFYEEDLPVIKACCNNLGFQFVDNKKKNNWIAAKFVI
ncbi:50S ribosomal protein L11 methyltransferase [Altibacter sp.]|uniref:50S ribosomal protein L11 methyltransferase n=1 Tax=Altibacter sp. TaxID=2024823 RepID=UPI000C959033|nr:50S ribosomal protein L11 methyltransferase [Altibacter sp.]MAP55371.1 50S ribosomal protein L11 methyltransferase [Altibacter sp.]|tara:strand:- start:51 stop:884 length:834 start_codon:yes stop_codon:yes gene_type:complete